MVFAAELSRDLANLLKMNKEEIQKMKDEVALLKNNHSIKDVFSHFESILSDPKFEKLKIQNKEYYY